jgi:N-acetylmuramoyl-L-alanine amidase
MGGDGVVVEPGDCLSSIAEAHGFAWETLWNHPKNAKLKEKRKNPNVLWPGDRVFVPAAKAKEVSCAVNRSHRFVVKGVPARLRIRFLEVGEPRRGEAYILTVDGRPRRGTLNNDGVLDESVSPLARSVQILFEGDSAPLDIALGGIKPLETVAGTQARLANLGFNPGPIDDLLGPKTRRALRRFQRKHNLNVTGEPDSETIEHLKRVHGS